MQYIYQYWDINIISYQCFSFCRDCQGGSDCYPEGSVTIYALNINPKVGDKISIEGELSNRMMDMYVATPGDEAGPLSK